MSLSSSVLVAMRCWRTRAALLSAIIHPLWPLVLFGSLRAQLFYYPVTDERRDVQSTPVKVPAKSAFAISLWLANLLTHLYTWPVGVVSEWKFTCGVPSGTSTGNNYKAKQLRIISNWAPGACRTRLPPKCNDRIIIGLVSLPLLLRNPLMESVDRALVLCFPLSLPDNSNQFGTRVHAPINIWLQVKSGRLAYPSQWIG